ncbi:MAG: hypothetical protein Kow0068_09710 [Marinilabiliales bacterium]
MKQIKLILLFVSLFTICHGQSNLDSLLQLAEKAEIKDLPAIYNEIAQEYLKPATLDKAEEYVKKALIIAKNQNQPDQEALAYKSLGNIEYYRQKYHSALDKYEKALIIMQKINDLEGSAAILYNMGIIHRNNGEYDLAIKKYTESLDIYKKLNDTLNIASTYQVIGISYFYWSKYNDAVENYQKSLELYKKVGDQAGIANCLQVIGVIYHEWGDYEKSLEFNQSALKIYEEMDDKYRIANSYINIGIVYKDWGNYQEKALEYFNKALDLMTEIDNKQGIAYSLSNIGSVYEDWENYQENDSINKNMNYLKAIEYHQKALVIEEEIGDKHGMAGTIESIGNVYAKMKEYRKSLTHNLKAMMIREEIDDESGIAQSYHSIGTVYMMIGDYSNALDYFYKALELAKKLKKLRLEQDVYYSISDVYGKIGDYKNAYINHVNYSILKDSLINIESHKQIAELEKKYQTEKKEQQIQHLNKEKEYLTEQQRLRDEKLKQKNIILLVSIIALSIFIIFSFFLFRLLRQIRKKNIELELKNREISDSIHYASRIQSAILPPKEYISEILPQHFIFAKPRDIVSGDFYWLARKDDKIIVAVADCTGHGVPGAFMSMLGVAFINEIVNQMTKISASEILNKLRDNVIRSLHQTGKEGEAADGMDIALCVVDKTTMNINFAGANNPLFVIRNNNLIEIKGDKMPVSYHVKHNVPFSEHNVQIQSGDVMYMFTDGFVDQFGGEHGKKYKYKPFKDLLIKISQLSMETQKNTLIDEFNSWKLAHEQVDDILILGFRI